MDMIFFLDERPCKTKVFSYAENQDAKTWAIISQRITHHSTINKFSLPTYLWKIT